MSSHSIKIDEYLQTHLDQYIEETIQICAQPSVSATGQGVRECAGLVQRILEHHHFKVDWFETKGNPILVGRACENLSEDQDVVKMISPNLGAERKRTLLFYNHYDVQPPEPLELWTSPPFEPVIRDGVLFARGVSDDKGEFIGRLAAVEAARIANGGKLPCGITFCLEGEEEVGSPNIAPFVLEHTKLLASQAAIWEVGGVDHLGRPGTTLGARGILAIELSVETLNRDAHSGGAHALPSAAWRLVRALASLKDEQERILIPGWYDGIIAPSEQDLLYLQQQPDMEDFMRQQYGIGKFLKGLTGMELRKAVFNPTCNIQGITTGWQGQGLKTIVPAKASAKIDFRLVPGQDPDDLERKLRNYLNQNGFADVHVHRFSAMWPAKASADDPFILLAAQLAPEVYGHELDIDPLGGGSSPIYAFAGPLGNIPVLWAGVGGPDGRAHSPDENIVIENFHKGARYIARIIDQFSNIG